MKHSINWLLALGTVVLSGCGSLKGPDPDPEPTRVPTPKPNFFDPKDFVNQGSPLNAANDPTKPVYFQLDQILSGTTLKLVGVTNKGTLLSSDVYHLEGIITPEKGQPGYDQTVKTIQDWTLGQHLDVELDTKYPFDSNNQKQVQVYFFGQPTKRSPDRPRLLLNRMLVRSGYAVCDLDQATSSNVEGWLNDEQYARQNVPPLGLWGTGIFTKIAQREPPPTPTPIGGANAASAPAGPGAAGNSTTIPATGGAVNGSSATVPAGTRATRHHRAATHSASNPAPTGSLPAPAPQ